MDMILADPGGMFGRNDDFGIRHRLDGTSNTLLVSEGIIRGSTRGCWGELGRWPWAGPRTAVSRLLRRALAEYDRARPGLPVQKHDRPAAACENGKAAPAGFSGRWNSPRSYHLGGANAALVDAPGAICDRDRRPDYVSAAAGCRMDGQTLGEW